MTWGRSNIKQRMYGRLARAPYKEGRCAAMVVHGCMWYQCSRKEGHGHEGLYCKQHAHRYPAGKEIDR